MKYTIFIKEFTSHNVKDRRMHCDAALYINTICPLYVVFIFLEEKNLFKIICIIIIIVLIYSPNIHCHRI